MRVPWDTGASKRRVEHHGSPRRSARLEDGRMVLHAEQSDASATLDGVRGVATRPRDLERGSVVGRYILLAPVGAGGMGLVFAAHDPELDRKVALKVLREDAIHTGASEGRRKLLREAQALARLAHPNVVSVHDVGVDAGRSFIAMEFIVGQTLRQWLDRRPRSEREVIDVFLAAGRGLAAAHAAGVVHGDVKPHNVLIADDGRVLVTDFGLARVLDKVTPPSAFEETAGRVSTDALAMTATDLGEAAGTPAYMAPEQFEAPSGGASAASDQFGFAVALWEGLAGRRPFQGDSLPALVAAMTSGRIDEGSTARIPRWLRPALRRALAPSPAQRHASLDPLLTAMANDPRRLRRRLAVAGGTVAIGLAGAATWGWSRYSAHQACAEQAETIAELVDEGSQARIRAALVDTGSAIATEAADEASRALSEYAATWSSSSRANCDAHVDGARTDTDFARSQSCLDDARVALAELVGELQRASDPASVAAMAGAMVSLPLLTACTDDAQLATQQALPEEPSRKDRVLELRRRLAKSEIERRLGRSDPALGDVGVLVDEAIATGWSPLVAEALLEHARHAGYHGDFATAEASAKRGFLAALTAGSDRLAADAATHLGLVVGPQLMRLAQGRDWLDLAETLYDRADDQGYARSKLLAVRGKLAEAEGHMVDAVALTERALEIRAEVLGADHPLLGPLLGDLGHLYAERGEHERALESLQRDLALMERAFGGTHPDIPDILVDIGGVFAAQGDLDGAAATFARALAMNDRIQGKDHVSRGYVLTSLANLYDDFGRIDEALAYHDEARRAFEKAYGPAHPYVATVLANAAVTLQKAGRAEAAKQSAERSLQIREAALGADHPDVAASLNALSDAQRALGQLEEARASAARGVAIREASLEPDDLSLVVSRGALAESLIELGKYDDAVAQLGMAIESSRKRLGDDHYQIAILSRQLAAAELGRGRTSSAAQALEQAMRGWDLDPLSAAVAAKAGYSLAKIEWDAGKRARARELALRALRTLRADGPGSVDIVREIEATLAGWEPVEETR